ncbi:hypothetical protein ACIPL1_30510 [Pseudomonas sp. NPDC090202]|uniref:hypothetical protein n=1 Tax=Pseudomonas sp. NPDC090202 TaxID=3364476 RepID=UPI0037F619D3
MAKSRTKVLGGVLLLVVAVGVWQSRGSSPVTSQEAAPIAVEDASLASSKQADQAQKDKKFAAIGAAKSAVLKRLTDPDSAKFGKIVYRESGVVCGFVNSKNVMGGYVGETAFISLGTPDLTWLRGQSKDFDATWNQRCANS